ncbi:hypothetical protein [Halomicrobium urmianum]|uniref:hypothetical protein n=1 Tax=Halomicrobium urmianum TaxID=1586233 RepID=UPI001CD9A64A|nr:hypothetical protein [Halomicrobium urmianum]
MATNVARVAIVAVIAVVLVSPFISVVDSNVGEQSVANESVTADVGNYVELDGYQLVDGSVTVEAEDGTSYSEGSDYEVDYESGELQALSGGNISDGETVYTSYDYESTSGTTTTIAGLLPLFLALLILVVLARAVMDRM